MPTVERELQIEAPIETVRRLVDDPDERRRWLDLDLTPTTDLGGVIRFGHHDEDGHAEVAIELLPDGETTRVHVTIELEPAEALEPEEVETETVETDVDGPMLLAA